MKRNRTEFESGHDSNVPSGVDNDEREEDSSTMEAGLVGNVFSDTNDEEDSATLTGVGAPSVGNKMQPESNNNCDDDVPSTGNGEQPEEVVPEIFSSGFSNTSRKFFESEQEVEDGGRRRIIAAAFLRKPDTKQFACKEETDYHFLAYAVAKLLPQSKLHLLEKLLFATRHTKFNEEEFITRPPYSSGELKKYYFNNVYSVQNQLPCEDTKFIDGHPYVSPVEKVSKKAQ